MAEDGAVDLEHDLRDLSLDNQDDRLVYNRLHVAVLSNDVDEITSLLNDSADVREKTYAKYPSTSEIECECTNLKFCFHQADEYGNEWKSGDVVAQNALHLAAKHSKLEVVKLLLDAIGDVDERSGDGSTALHYSMQNSDIEVARLLLESGAADVEARNDDGKTPLYLAVKFERVDLVCYLLSRGANVNVFTKNQSTPLYSALINCNEELVQILLDSKASTDVRNKYCEEPLFFVLRVVDKGESRLGFARLLIDNGVNLQNRDRHGSTPLHIAVQNRDEEMATLLIDRGCHIDTKNPFDMSPLTLAVCMNMVSMARLLLKRGANVNEFFIRSSILEYVVMRRNAELVQLLLEFNADVNAGSESNSPVFAASLHRHTNIMHMLIDKGADINCKDKKGRTPLMRSIEIKNYAMMQLLINRGASVNQQDNHGNTVFHVLFESSHTEEGWTEYLLDVGADFNIENNSGHTPFACMMMASFTRRHVQLFIKYIVLHLARGSSVNPKITCYLIASPTWSKAYNLYTQELERMKKVKIFQKEKYTFFDVLSKKSAFLTPVLKEENNIHFEMGLIANQFDYYSEMTRKVFYKKVERLKCLNSCISLLNSVFETELPPEIVERVCDFLTNEEMMELQAAAETTVID
ncbi:putative ankyrin repeat protein RF_0381 isoform X1 [Nasonia vitripennis]|uniref:PRANC domain-containing protein n=1 Tax=Nasonia vitripennis TaxID=7425 RepID=A0A7M7HHJ8_NASVI|nr:putative ankyrin repeat protein RF_0381 isoform X1 [Nasonia vitripennis]XP_008216265.1 putative ankyrin repeat protein RF_0381 isoform X1 [Nasonia vitripennis]XP_008216266.1 putative ankyrin repeat protein RF_0381 isoform X1 [Nasonia vitripennis]